MASRLFTSKLTFEEIFEQAGLSTRRRAATRGVNVEAWVRQSDGFMRRVEDENVAFIMDLTQRAQRDLEREFRRRYPEALEDVLNADRNRVFAEARANMLNAQLQGHYEAMNLVNAGVDEEVLYNSLYNAAMGAGARAHSLVDQFQGVFNEVDLQAFEQMLQNTVVDMDSIRMVANNSAARLHRYSADQTRRMQEVVSSGLVRGASVPVVTRELRAETGLLRYQAERIVRTETAHASDEARVESFVGRGIQYVQRIATMDERTCPQCAARAGNVYEIGKAPAALHPNDRCMNVPWSPEWVELGLTDDDWLVEDKQRLLDQIPEDKRVTDRAMAPFERMNELDVPEPVWTVEDVGKARSVETVPEQREWNPVGYDEARKILDRDEERPSSTIQRGYEYYTTNTGYKDFNGYMRGEHELTHYQQRQVDLMQEDLLQNRISTDAKLFRGIRMHRDSLPADPRETIGSVMSNPGFASTSINEQIAEGMISGLALQPDQVPVLWEIRARAGETPGRWIRDYSRMRGEDEYLLPAGMGFEVVDVIVEGKIKGKHKIRMVVEAVLNP